ncbi:hypothetical protein [Aquamicrobium sp. LC103]|uniref:hypothetical protein n=1 Tax=Aquamicrobium sp. LC103 TaxID=1120658 RepID=UPI00063E79E4|nr:hypothetical protein [Aquamicrobium sp. LC103]TKT75009.1 hypothetical protein XW59_021295 [Aquamicrobium sp. LC103]
MSAGGWGDFDTWHELFDALCNRRGWYDNNDPASELCARLGKNSRQDFEAAKKKLRAWRAGRRLPLRRNLATLAQLLEVDGDPELERRWLTLYRHATMADDTSDAHVAPQAMGHAGRRVPTGWALAGMALLLGSGAVYAAMASSRHAALAALPQVSFEGYVRIPVGTSHLIHGALESCESEAPEWDEIAATLPQTPYGALTDGGLVRKVVRRCTAEKLVRGVRFTGIAPGTAELRLFGDYVKVDVVTIKPEAANEGK